MRKLLALSLLTACGGTTDAAMPAAEPPPAYRLVWADEFDKDGLPDSARWDYDTEFNQRGWFNNEKQYYSKGRLENARVENGKLIITARKEELRSTADWGGQKYSSARLLTRGKASWTYGMVEVRAKLPCAVGSWPAIWMLGTKGRWPEDGEIDIMEHVGKEPNVILGSIYTGAYNWPKNTPITTKTPVPDVCGSFHTYQLTWTPERMDIGVDGRNYQQLVKAKDADYQKWPFDQPQYLLLNLAVGGDLGGPVDDSSFPWQFEIDYVRVYQR
ncbi:glycoside hydrolase family 16 protein [Massilia endophytica]|uniref:glycoside hydrolase family 16 protein n=1 Tax=Massilia endophytica TaxID=2899220 RepID=UPI001E4FDC1D|nr:glycoside hydrolase family 16 protein [Massilia endophytica]UGQ46940.1 glycoside hydrolase family 16 protein [Massilia endophytica]